MKKEYSEMPTWPCVQSMRLHVKLNIQRLQHKDRAVIRQLCNIKPEVVAIVSGGL